MRPEKLAIVEAVDRLADELEQLSRRIHDNPELGYEELKACGWLTEFLGRQGFKVEKGVGGVDTAFRATIETGEGATIAILCEYDALPGIGHACGHNVIATAGAGAGAALAAIRAQLPRGRIHVLGTPAEEGGGGKIRLIKAGLFKTVDCAEGAARAPGATLTVTQQDNVYEPLKRNQPLLDLFAQNMTTVGMKEGEPIRDRMGSSDIGNVSQIVPAIQPMVAIAPTGMAIHTREFADAALQPMARAGMLAAAKTLALTAFDLLAEPARVQAAKDEFARAR